MCKGDASLFLVSVAFSLSFYHSLFPSPLCICPWLSHCLPPSQDPVSMVTRVSMPLPGIVSPEIGCLLGLLPSLPLCRCQCVVYWKKLLNPWLTHSSVYGFVVNLTSDFWIFLALNYDHIFNKLSRNFCFDPIIKNHISTRAYVHHSYTFSLCYNAIAKQPYSFW